MEKTAQPNRDTETPAIIHLDGDAFFASCETAQNPKLRGKCVVTGLERGIASSMSYEAKARGVTRGMTLNHIRQVCPEAVIVSSDYLIYRIFSRRMFTIVRRYTNHVEEYGIDEGFADITHVPTGEREALARAIQQDLLIELDLSYSFGLATTKVLAKIASKRGKPKGLVVLTEARRIEYLAEVPIGAVWGIGPANAGELRKLGISSALEFTQKDEWWVREHCDKPHVEIWHELCGRSVIPLSINREHETPQSISRTRTFKPPSSSASFLFAQLSQNAEQACEKLRRQGMRARRVSFFLKTQSFLYSGLDIELPHATASTNDIVRSLQRPFKETYHADVPYRASGVTLHDIVRESKIHPDLFGGETKAQEDLSLYTHIDALNRKYGDAVFLGSSMQGRTKQHPRRLSIPIIGSVT